MGYRLPPKKPSGSRPLPSSSTDMSRTVPSHSDPQLPAKLHRNDRPSTLHRVEQNEDQPTINAPWKDGIDTPSQFDEISLAPDPQPVRSGRRTAIYPPEPIDDRSDSPKPTSLTRDPGSPKRRWENLRSYVLHSPGPSTDSFVIPSRAASPKPSFSVPVRSSTPKPLSRFPRLGMRQIVDTARAVADDTRKFTEELERACADARFVDLTRPSRIEREVSQGTASSYLSIPMTVTASSSSLPPNGMAKQPSQQSLSSHRPSVDGLLRTLERYEGSPIHRPRTLPLENQVLSALLMPFLSPGVIDAERELAFQAFILIIKTWRSMTNEAELNRCLWCCNAASTSTKYRPEILGTLSSLLFSRDSSFRTDSPIVFQTLLQGLFSLCPFLSSSPADQKTIRALISEILSGGSGLLSTEAVEQEFDCSYSPKDVEYQIREALAVESIARCVANGSCPSRCWILRNLVEEYWPLPPPTLSISPLLMRIYGRKINSFTRAVLSLLTLSDPVQSLEICEPILRIVEMRILPEISCFFKDDGGETKELVVLLLLRILCIESEIDGPSKSATLIERCFREVSMWRNEAERCLCRLIESDDIHVVVSVLSALKMSLAEDLQKPVSALYFPKLCERLVSQPSSAAYGPVKKLLQSIAKAFPQLFFKPLFACAASNKELSVVNQLCIMVSLSTHMPDFWTADAEMMSVALMGRSVSTDSGTGDRGTVWDQARLGPTVILLELIGRLQIIREARERSSDFVDSNQDEINAFATSLESRLAILLDVKERHTFIPFSQRILFCALFLEIRLLTNSLKPTTWLSRVVSWIIQWYDQPPGDGFGSSPFDEEVNRTMTKLQALYSTAKVGFQTNFKRRSTILSTPIMVTDFTSDSTNLEPLLRLTERIQLISSFSFRLELSVFPLLVAASGMVSTADYIRLSTVLWKNCLDDTNNKVLSPTCFLVMQCAEKCPTEFVQCIQTDMISSDAVQRRQAIQKLAILLSWRFQIHSQRVILDRSYRRPFKLTRPPISFVPADIGSSQYVREENADQIKDKTSKSLPLELRQRLLEIGWEDDDKPVDQRLEWAQTPMSLLPSTQLAKVGGEDIALVAGAFHAIFEQVAQKQVPRDAPSPRKSTGDHVATRKPVFVTSLVSVFPRLAVLVFDSELSVANEARNLLLDMMRDDPSILARSVFNVITGDESELASAISTLRAFLHVRHTLPPPTAHHVFTHLIGYLKFAARQVETADALQGFAYTVPVLARLVPQVNNMSMREIRRAKIEAFLIPTFSLWFHASAPAGPMFPRSIKEIPENPFQTHPMLVWITIIRISQNMLFLSMLKKSPQDVHVIRKNLTHLVLPCDKRHQGLLELTDFIPRRQPSGHFAAGSISTAGLSLILSRSYLLLVAQIFRSMSRHTSDRSDFAILIDGINRILLAHGDDTGIVGQAMIALMVASTRFRRLFTSAGGYTMFMPVVYKAYTEANEHSAIRLAIEYAINRFYALHQEAFVFQTIDIVSILILGPNGSDVAWTARALFSLLSTLKAPTFLTSPDPAGIHNANKGQEREALIVKTVEEKPQGLFEHIKTVKGQEIFRMVGHEFTLDVPEEYEDKRFGLEDFVRMFLTVIAHNPAISRAEHFLRLFRYLVPDLYHASTTVRVVLTEGVAALGGIFLIKPAGKTKLSENVFIHPDGEMKPEVFNLDDISPDDRLLAKANSPVDLLTMRMEYLSLIVAFTRAGGNLRGSASLRVVELVKTILRDSRQLSGRISDFLGEYAKNSLLRAQPPSTKYIVAFLDDLAPLVSAYHIELDLSEVLSAVSRLVGNSLYASDIQFSRVVTQYCAAGLEACELAASEGLIFSLSLRSSVVELMSYCVTLPGVDIISQLERRSASYELLAGVVLPFALSLKPTMQAIVKADPSSVHPDTYARVWVRLLAYVISACKTPTLSRESNRSGSPTPGERKNAEKRYITPEAVPIPTLAVSMQIIKVIVIKAGEDLSIVLPDVWSRIGAFLKDALSDGDASFALYPTGLSQPSSPIQSPRGSTFSDQKQQSPYPSPRNSTVRPRVVDYLLWSLFELLCLHRTPLLLQIRLMMQEKVRTLEDQLQLDRNVMPMSSSVRSSRRVSAVFSKRGRSSRYSPSAMSVENSPNLRPTAVEFSSAASTPTKVGREAGYLWSSPTGQRPSGGPQIVHLGPIPHSALFRGLELEGRGSMRLVNSTAIKSIALIHETFRRVRLVQSCLGYSMLLPYPEADRRHNVEEYEEDISGWTKMKALQSIVDETKQLLDEFGKRDENFGFEEVGDNIVVVDADQSLSLLSNV